MSAAPAPNPNGSSPGVIVVGLDRPSLVESTLNEHPEQPNGYCAPVYLLEPDRERAEGVASIYRDIPRIRCFFGPGAEERLIEWLRQRLHLVSIPRTIEVSGQHHANRAREIAAKLGQLTHEQANAINACRTTIEQRVLNRQGEGLSQRFSDIHSGSRARVLIITTRYSTFIQHACEDLATSLRALGHEIMLLREPDTQSTITPLMCLEAQCSFDPDVCIVVNYPRSLHSELFPAGVPHVCWVQDAMSHLFSPLPSDPGSCEFMAGHIYRTAAAAKAYPEAQRLEFPVPISTQKFHPDPVSDELKEQYACDIAYISHQSQPASLFHDEFAARFPANMLDHFNAMREQLQAIVSRWDSMYVHKELMALSRDMSAGFGKEDDMQVQQVLWNQYLHPMLERMLRHQTLAWAATISERHGLDLRLYGRGWEQHPTLGRFASGELPHGEPLRAAYQCSRVQLHASSMGCGHQRLGECVLSGGLMLTRRSWDEFSRDNLYRARAYIEGEAMPDACLISERQMCYSLRNHPELRSILQERNRMPRPPLGWDHEPLGEEVYTEIEGHPWVRYIDGPVPDPSQRALTLLDDPFGLTFSTGEELESGILRGIEDDAWRNERSAAVRARVSERVSMDRFASSLLDMVCARLCTRHETVHAGAGA